MKLAFVLAALLLIAGCLVLMACFRRERDWSKAKVATQTLNGLLRVTVPEDLRYDPRMVEHTPDSVEFTFQRVNDTHLNGTTSYAETLRILVFARDCEERVFDEAVKRRLRFGRREESVETRVEGPLTWRHRGWVYERHPVKEPSWEVRLIDREGRFLIDWWGYQKQYSLEQAKANLVFVRSNLQLATDLAGYLRPHRPWSVETEEATEEANLRHLREALQGVGFAPLQESGWTRHQQWRYLVDDERPRRFQLVRLLGHIPKPEIPVLLDGPITQVRYQQQRWVQNTQVPGAEEVPSAHLAGLTAEQASTSEVYLYFMRTVNLWEPHEGEGNPLLGRLKALLAEGEAAQRQFVAGRLHHFGDRE